MQITPNTTLSKRAQQDWTGEHPICPWFDILPLTISWICHPTAGHFPSQQTQIPNLAGPQIILRALLLQ